MTCHPQAFIENLKYMGLGMGGIFLSIGIIVLITVILNQLQKRS